MIIPPVLIVIAIIVLVALALDAIINLGGDE